MVWETVELCHGLFDLFLVTDTCICSSKRSRYRISQNKCTVSVAKRGCHSEVNQVDDGYETR